MEESSGCARNASGAYGSVCVELESDALCVCALLQAHHILQAEGTSVAVSFANAHQHSIQDVMAHTGTNTLINIYTHSYTYSHTLVHIYTHSCIHIHSYPGITRSHKYNTKTTTVST